MKLNSAWIGNPLLNQLAIEGTGETNLARAEPGLAIFTAPFDLLIVHMAVVVRDRGVSLKSDGFGCRSEPLEHGFAFSVRTAEGDIVPALPGNVIKKNLDFLRWSENLEEMTWGNMIREQGFAAHYEPYGSWGLPFYLTQGQAIAAGFLDDLSFLTEFGIYLVCAKVRPPRDV